MWRFSSAVLATFLLWLVPSFSADFTAKVVSVADGDTLTVQGPTETLRIRLNGIDAPEGNQAFAAKAKSLLNVLSKDKVVHVKTVGKDQYGRWLADVVLPPTRSLNQEMVRQGLAWHFKRYSQDKVLAQLETEAREAKKGLWSDSDPIPPWEWREKIRRGEIVSATPTPIRIKVDGAYKTETERDGFTNAPVNPSSPTGVIGNSKSRIYHPPGCKHLSNMKPDNIVRFPSAAAAEKAGYRHCQ